MNFKTITVLLWIYLCLASANEVEYTSDSEIFSNVLIQQDKHYIQKRQATSQTASPTQPGSVTTTSGSAATTPISIIKEEISAKYYNKTVIHHHGNEYWDELVNHTKHSISNGYHLTTSAINLKFPMPFYGHTTNRIQVTTGGFLYMGPIVHRLLTYSQYVAPLMANFDTHDESSDILNKEYGAESIVIEWRNVFLNQQKNLGSYTFQVKLYVNGTIIFVYKKVPTMEMDQSGHPVKIGLSDAYYIRFYRNGQPYIYIQPYHNVTVNRTLITENTVIILEPLPTCNTFKNCSQCLTAEADFECSWCAAVSRCSDGTDWHKQEWDEYSCTQNAISEEANCPVPTSPTSIVSTKASTTMQPTTTTTTLSKGSTSITTHTSTTRTTKLISKPTSTTTPTTTTTPLPTSSPNTGQPPKVAANRQSKSKGSSVKVGGLVAIIALVLLFIGLGIGWVIYGYTHPTSRSGQWLIEHRPALLKAKLGKMFERSTETGEKYKVKNDDIESDLAESIA